MSDRICFLHVGTGKTGSSAIQYALTEARRALRSQGYLYPDAGDNFHRVLRGYPTGGNAAKLLEVLRDSGSEPAIELIRRFSRNSRNLILSCEGLSYIPGRVLQEFGTGLRSLGYELRCLVFFRPQAEMMISSYLQQTKANKFAEAVGLEDYVVKQLVPDTMATKWNWYRRTQKLERAFGDGNVLVKWYPSVARVGADGVVRATFAWLDLPSMQNSIVPSSKIVNPTPGREALIILLMTNAEGIGGKRFAYDFLASAQSNGLLGAKVRMKPELRAKVEDATRESNTELLDYYCSDLSANEELKASTLQDPDEPIDIEKLKQLARIAQPLLPSAMSRIRHAFGGTEFTQRVLQFAQAHPAA